MRLKSIYSSMVKSNFTMGRGRRFGGAKQAVVGNPIEHPVSQEGLVALLRNGKLY